MITNDKKAFDPTVCFTFFGNWLKVIERLETEEDKNSAAHTLFKAIANYSMYDIEPDFSKHPILEHFWILVEKDIDISITNRKRGFAADELNEKYQSIINAIAEKPNASLREIGEITNTSKDMVRRVKTKYKEQIQEAVNNRFNSNVDIVCSDSNIVVNGCNTFNDGYIANDGIRHDTDATARQFYEDYSSYADDDLPF